MSATTRRPGRHHRHRPLPTSRCCSWATATLRQTISPRWWQTWRTGRPHVSIAQAEPACVAPIGQAWDLALSRDPTLTLHAPDGNHSASAGAFLAALVLYATITGLSPLDLPPLSQYPVDASLQATLRGIAAETVQTVPPRMWCPADTV